MKKKLLITGSAGFIFGNFVRKLFKDGLDKEYEIVSIDKMMNYPIQGNLYINKSHQFYLGDIADSHFINRVFEYERPDIVIHGAAESAVDKSITDPNIFIHSNVLGTQIITNACVKFNIERLIYISTDETTSVLKSENDPLCTEDVPLNPGNFYSASKAAGELIVKAAYNTFGLNYNITRCCNNYGWRQTPDKLIPKVIKCIFNDEKIPVYGRGLQMRDWLNVVDNCSAIFKILECGKINEVYNISANMEYTNIEVVNLICNMLGNKHHLISFVEDRKGHDFRYGVDSGKIRALGWKPEIKFKEGLEDCIVWYQKNKNFLNN